MQVYDSTPQTNHKRHRGAATGEIEMEHGKLARLTARAKAGISRRDFMRTAASAGLSAAMAGSLWSEAQAATPQKGGTLKAGADGGATTDTFNPLQMNGADHPTLSILSSYDTLTEIDETGAPQPSLAESWEGNVDGTWAIKLRKGVEFHDGKTLTAEDVVWSLFARSSPWLPVTGTAGGRFKCYAQNQSRTGRLVAWRE